MKIAAALGVLGLAMGIGACGTAGNAPAEEPVREAPATSTGKQTAAKHPSEPKCEQTEILRGSQQEGSCSLGPSRVVAVNGHSLLALRTVNVAVRNIGVNERIPGRHGNVSARAGAFVLITLEIENRDKVPHRFSLGQTVLGIENQNYEESAEVERQVWPGALAYHTRHAIPPKGVVRGDVVFDVPAPELQRVSSMGRLFVGNFGTAPFREVKKRGGEFGFIRLYR